MRNSWIKVLSITAASVFLCACASTDTVQAPGEKHQVALIAKSTSTEFWRSVFTGAQAAATEYNLNLTITGPETEEDYETQNTMVAQAVEYGAEAIVFSAIDFENNASAIDEASAAGAKIVAIDSNVDSEASSTYIGTDNFAAGQMAAQAALQCGYDKLFVGLVNYDINSYNGQERERGVLDTFKNMKNVTLVDTINVLAVAQNAQAGTVAMLQQHPEINVMIAFNEPVSVGAARAIHELKLSDKVWLVGFDSNVETVDDIQTGAVDALIVQNPYAMGYLGVESAYKLINGQAGTLEKTVDTTTMIVNLENMFTPDSQKALFPFN